MQNSPYFFPEIFIAPRSPGKTYYFKLFWQNFLPIKMQYGRQQFFSRQIPGNAEYDEYGWIVGFDISIHKPNFQFTIYNE